MNIVPTLLVCASFAALLAGCSTTNRLPRVDIVQRDVAARLDTLHDAASKADAQRYWSCFAPDAVFMGTDATERWILDEFRAYADPLFSQGRGWTYRVLERHIHSDPRNPDQLVAWFDERLVNEKYGECRGSGVLICRPSPPDRADEWLIAQYNLTVPIPNDLLPDFAQRIRDFNSRADPAR